MLFTQLGNEKHRICHFKIYGVLRIKILNMIGTFYASNIVKNLLKHFLKIT